MEIPLKELEHIATHQFWCAKDYLKKSKHLIRLKRNKLANTIYALGCVAESMSFLKATKETLDHIDAQVESPQDRIDAGMARKTAKWLARRK